MHHTFLHSYLDAKKILIYFYLYELKITKEKNWDFDTNVDIISLLGGIQWDTVRFGRMDSQRQHQCLLDSSPQHWLHMARLATWGHCH